MSYRDPVDALHSRREALEEKLAGLDTRRRELEQVQDAAHEAREELEDTRRQLRELSARRALPTLETLRIASPCKAEWDEMRGDDKTRHCAVCDKDVHDISAFTREEAEALVRGPGGAPCVRLWKRRDGTVLTSDCPVGERSRVRRRRLAVLAVGGGVLTAAGTGAMALTMGAPCPVGGHEQVMGELEVVVGADAPLLAPPPAGAASAEASSAPSPEQAGAAPSGEVLAPPSPAAD